MTSTPVKDVGFGLKGPVSAGNNLKAATDGGFQAVWNSQTEKQADSAGQQDVNRSVKKTPGDSMKARDEHRARTEKREPSRDVEERTDIPEENLENPEEAAEVLGAAAAEMIREVADTLGMEPEAVQAVMESLGMTSTDILTPQGLGDLILAAAGEENASALLTDEGLYGSYQELMGQLTSLLQEAGQTLELSPEQLTEVIGRSMEQVIEQPVGQSHAAGEMMQAQPEITVEVEEPKDEDTESLRQEIPEEVRSAGQESTAREADRSTGDRQGQMAQEDRKEGRHGDSREQGTGMNLFAQNLRAGQYEPQVQQTAGAESVWDTDTQDIMRQIMDYMRINLKAEAPTMEMQLHPASLGTLQIQIASKGGVVTANFIAQNEAVKAALESQMVQLQEQFEEQGVKVAAIEVTVQTHQFEQNLEQGRRGAGQEQESAKKGRVRRLRLDDSVSGEEMTEEDALAKDIMAANGNSVDYTA